MLMEKAWAGQRGGFNNMDFGRSRTASPWSATRPQRSPAPRSRGRPRPASRSSTRTPTTWRGANKTARTIDVQHPHGRNHLPCLAVGDFRMIFEWSGILDSSVK
jgi:hypothetical protein